MKIFKSNNLSMDNFQKNIFEKKYPGITEYIADKNNIKKFAMLIYNKELSVCPLTTHIPLKKVNKFITRKNVFEKVKLINNFFLKHKNIKPHIGILGLNPHCESIDSFNEDDKILKPAVKSLKKLGFKVSGPYPADTVFLKKNRAKFDSILACIMISFNSMKTLFEYDAINITLVYFHKNFSDHGPNVKMVGKNKSNPLSLIRALEFFG